MFVEYLVMVRIIFNCFFDCFYGGVLIFIGLGCGDCFCVSLNVGEEFQVFFLYVNELVLSFLKFLVELMEFIKGFVYLV